MRHGGGSVINGIASVTSDVPLGNALDPAAFLAS